MILLHGKDRTCSCRWKHVCFHFKCQRYRIINCGRTFLSHAKYHLRLVQLLKIQLECKVLASSGRSAWEALIYKGLQVICKISPCFCFLLAVGLKFHLVTNLAARWLESLLESISCCLVGLVTVYSCNNELKGTVREPTIQRLAKLTRSGQYQWSREPPLHYLFGGFG